MALAGWAQVDAHSQPAWLQFAQMQVQ